MAVQRLSYCRDPGHFISGGDLKPFRGSWRFTVPFVFFHKAVLISNFYQEVPEDVAFVYTFECAVQMPLDGFKRNKSKASLLFKPASQPEHLLRQANVVTFLEAYGTSNAMGLTWIMVS